MEQILKVHRDDALRLLKENHESIRDGIELIVRNNLPSLARAAGLKGATPEALEGFYAELLAQAYNMFALGYTFCKTGGRIE